MEHSKNSTNYKQVYAIKAEREKRIKKICPNIPYSSGIYVFYRDDETGIRRAYCGQAVKLCERCAAHLGEYDHIALSLKKHGFYSEDNIYGWKLYFKTCPKEELDENEIATIRQLSNSGYQLYNLTAGGQGQGKKAIGEYKPARTYRDGILQGKKTLARELKHIIDTHLVITLKKPSKTSEKAFLKFNDLLDENNYKSEREVK